MGKNAVSLLRCAAATTLLALGCSQNATLVEAMAGSDAAAGSGGQDAGSEVSTGGTAGGGGADATAGNGGSGGAGGSAGLSGGQPCGGSEICGPREECGSAEGTPLCVAKSVQVNLADGGPGYTIDATEVTFSQYGGWLATNPTCPPSTPGDVCSWKWSYSVGGGTGSYPVFGVDWCDAYAYCRGVGKRLCGKIGGGANGWGDHANASLSQWYNACSSGGLNNFPYGGNPQTSTTDGYDGQKCNGVDKSVGANMPVGTCPDCTSTESGYTGVYDLSGNVWEWEDSCDGSTGTSDHCRMRGGAFSCGTGALQCAYVYGGIPRSYYSTDYGLRCCSDP